MFRLTHPGWPQVLSPVPYAVEGMDFMGLSGGSSPDAPADSYCGVSGGSPIGGGSSPASPLKITAAGSSDIGLQREENEDHFALLMDRSLFVVADGMGGHQGGRVASQMAVASIDVAFRPSADPLPPTRRAEDLRQAIQVAHREILRVGRLERVLKGMGTTVAALHIHEGWSYVAHAGDSRVYRIRKGRIQQLTRDHTLVNQMIEMGAPDTTIQIAREKFPHIVTSGLGTAQEIRIEVTIEPIEAGDLFLLCTDGLTGVLRDQAILEIISSTKPLDVACEELILRANEGGGPDNITALLVKVESV